MVWGIIGWIAIGVVAGFIATKLVNLRGDDPRIGMGVSGAAGLLGGWLYSLISGAEITRFNIWSLASAALAAVLALTAWHIVRGRRQYSAPTVRRSY